MSRKILFATAAICLWAVVLMPVPVQGTISPISDLFFSLFGNTIDAVGDIAAGLTGGVRDVFNNTGLEGFGDIIGGIGDTVKNLTAETSKVVDIANLIATGLIQKFVDVPADAILKFIGLDKPIEGFLNGIYDLINRTLVDLPLEVQTGANGVTKGVGDAIKDLLNALNLTDTNPDRSSSVLNASIKMLKELIKGIDILSCQGDPANNVIHSLVKLVVAGVGSPVTAILCEVLAGTKELGSALLDILLIVVGTIVGIVQGVLQVITAKAGGCGDLGKLIDGLVDEAKTALEEAIKNLGNLTTNGNVTVKAGTIESIICNLQKITDLLGHLGSETEFSFNCLLRSVIDAVIGIVALVGELVGQGAATVGAIVGCLVTAIIGLVLAVLCAVLGAGAAAGAGAAGGLSAALSAALGVAASIIGGIGADNAFGIELGVNVKIGLEALVKLIVGISADITVSV